METIPCPGCRTALGPEVTVCPICTRPRSKYEITRAYATLRAEQARKRKRPFIIAAYLLGAGAIGWLGFRFRAPLTAALTAARGRLRGFMDHATDPAHLTTQAAANASDEAEMPEAPVTAAAPAPAAQAAQAAPGAVPSHPAAAVNANAPAVAGAVMPVRPRPKGDLPIGALDTENQWALRGWVYDLVTLEPAPSVSFSVRGPGGGLMGAFTSDLDGRYLVVLPRLSEGGFEIVGSGPGYASSVYYESDIPYAQLSASERKEMAANGRVGDNHSSPVSDIIGEDSIHRDLFVVPRR